MLCKFLDSHILQLLFKTLNYIFLEDLDGIGRLDVGDVKLKTHKLEVDTVIITCPVGLSIVGMLKWVLMMSLMVLGRQY